jgi:nitrate/TMAO reductase-like tetraheme cytochrome c subunit
VSAPERLKPPGLIQNWVSLLGINLAASAFFAAVILLTLNAFARFSNPYVGILIFVVAPFFLIVGLLLIVIGALRERRRRRRLLPGQVSEYPRIDLNLPAQRHAVMGVVVVGVAFLLVTAVGSYQTYEYTESVAFCGETCHQVMRPEHTAYVNGPHARIACAECHIGPGAGWFVRSKLSGAYQVYATLADRYPRPIPTPIENLRPAQVTCEECHWPAKFYGDAERVREHFLEDETNSVWTVRLIMKVGGADPGRGPVGGIHWHMNIANRIEYIATDPQRQVIPWVRITRRDGSTQVFQTSEGALSDEQVAAATPRVMDCMDCHNRPAHDYLSPQQALDNALSIGAIDRSIPWIRKKAAEVLDQPYETTPAALAGIATGLRDFYQSKHPDFFAAHRDTLERAITEVQQIYRVNFFPEMHADWKVYPNNIGHMRFPGCYRCHDGEHKSSIGTVIPKDCNDCHTIVAQGPDAAAGPPGVGFQHPVDIDDMWQQMPCDACHGANAS